MRTLFEESTITCGNPNGPILLHGMREELARELGEACKAAGQVPECYLDAERATAAFRGLAEDGDDAWTRNEIRDSFDMEPGFGKHMDRLLDYVNTLGWAYWRLYRAERRAYGKGDA
jgi:hypothetical protein